MEDSEELMASKADADANREKLHGRVSYKSIHFCVQNCVMKKTHNLYLYGAFVFFFQIEELQNKLVEAETDKNVSLDQLQQKELEIQKLVSEKNCKCLRVYLLLVLSLMLMI